MTQVTPGKSLSWLNITTLASGSNQGALKLWNLQNIRRELQALGLDWR